MEPTWELKQGHVLDVLHAMPAESVQCVVTSPPYWGLRAYRTEPQIWGDADCAHESSGLVRNGVSGGGASASTLVETHDSLFRRVPETTQATCAHCGAWRGELGSEPTIELYVEHIVAVFREVRRVLRNDGTLWLNISDSYSGSGRGPTGKNGIWNQSERQGFVGTPRARPYDTDDKGFLGSPDPDSAYRHLCDECLVAWSNHNARMSGLALTGEHDERTGQSTDALGLDSSLSIRGDAALSVPLSTNLESWQRLRGECSRCADRAALFQSLPQSSSGDALAFAHTAAYRSGSEPPASAARSLDTGVSDSAYRYSTMASPKSKDLCLIPFRLALALQADGWWVRSDIAWCKRAPMPESVTDRPTAAWEHIFLLSKSARYYYDADAVREEASPNTAIKLPYGRYHNAGDRKQEPPGSWNRNNSSFTESASAVVESRNIRNYWLLSPEPFPESHFAVFPTEIPRRCILAGSKEGDTVLDPFAGSGTTLMVALRHGRRAVGIELNPEYVAMAKARIVGDAPLFNGVLA